MLTNLSPVITIFELVPLLHSLSLSLLPQTHYHLLKAILGFCSCVYQRPDGFIYPPLNLNPTQTDVRGFREFKCYLATGSSSIVESQTGEQTSCVYPSFLSSNFSCYITGDLLLSPGLDLLRCYSNYAKRCF